MNLTGTNVTKSYANGVLTLSGIDFFAPLTLDGAATHTINYQTLLNGITYDDTASSPTLGTDRVITIQAYDGISYSNLATVNVTLGPSVAPVGPTVTSVTPNLTVLGGANVGSQAFTLTVVYDEAMNTSINPTISFPTSGEDPTALPATLTFDSGSWTSDTTYVATYDVANQNVAMPAVDVQVSGGQDPTASRRRATRRPTPSASRWPPPRSLASPRI